MFHKNCTNYESSLYNFTTVSRGVFDLSGQSGGGTIRGKVVDATTNEPVPFASVVIWNTTVGAMTDFDGNFLFTGIKPGYIEM